MKTQDIFIAHPQTSEQISALRAFMDAPKIKFEIVQEETYNPEFVLKIRESRRQAKEGKVTRVKKEGLRNFLSIA
ncbi:MAG: DUF2683 family protein [Chitinophagaceae bacterium]